MHVIGGHGKEFRSTKRAGSGKDVRTGRPLSLFPTVSRNLTLVAQELPGTFDYFKCNRWSSMPALVMSISWHDWTAVGETEAVRRNLKSMANNK